MNDLAKRRGLETEVYQPAADSRLLANACLDRIESSDIVLEVGTGSGWVAERIATETGADVVASDLNPHACRAAAERGLPVVRANLVDPFLDETFDVVAFNPPYLPTAPDEGHDDWMERALSGGESGRAIIEPFLEVVPRVLSVDGRVLLLVSTLTGVEAVTELAGDVGFHVTVVEEDSFPFETLSVLELFQ